MNCQSEQYRFSRVEVDHTILARLEEQFSDRAVCLEEMEAAVAKELAREALCAPWRKSEPERAGCREGMWLAAVQFLSRYRAAIHGVPFRHRTRVHTHLLLESVLRLRNISCGIHSRARIAAFQMISSSQRTLEQRTKSVGL